MAAGDVDILMQRLRSLVAAPWTKELSDGQLLELFAATHDQVAFEALMRRHGRLVHGACRRLLGPGPDADDAYQAAFLVLARKAASIRRQTSVASWLYGVAHRVSRDLKAKIARRTRHEHGGGEGDLASIAEAKAMSSDPAQQASLRELAAILDGEVQRLPKRNREALVLCHLEGFSAAEAAKQLGCPLPTLKSRLERARELIRGRLVRCGITLSAASLAVVFSEQAARAMVPAKLAHATLKAAVAFAGKAAAGSVGSAQAVALANGVLKMMVTTKISVACVAVVLTGVLTWAAAVMPGEEPTTRPFVDARTRATVSVVQPKAKEQPAKGFVDLLGDELPAGAIARLGTLRFKHEPGQSSIITGAVFSPDGKRIASLASYSSGGIGGIGKKTVRLWETATGKELDGPWKEDDQGGFSAVAFSPDGALMAAIGRKLETKAPGDYHVAEGRRIAIWDIPRKKIARIIDTYPEQVVALVFADSGKTLVTAFGNAILWWDVGTGKVSRSWTGLEGAGLLGNAGGKKDSIHIASATLSPDATHLAAQTYLIVDEGNGTGKERRTRSGSLVGHQLPQRSLEVPGHIANRARVFPRR